MCCGVTGTALMVRVGVGDRAAVLARPHVRPMRLGARELSGFGWARHLGAARRGRARASPAATAMTAAAPRNATW